VHHNQLVAAANKLRAIVPSVAAATSVVGFEPAADRGKVTVRYLYDFACADPEQPLEVAVELVPLAARMLNDEALAAHRAGRFEAAAEGFARAAALDPGYELAPSNEACAWNRLGRPQDALRALAPLIRDNPVLAYSKVASDPELQSLKDAPPIAALRAGTPGAVQTEALLAAAAPLVGFAGRAVAVPIREDSWGSGNFRLDLAVYAAASGAEQLTVTLSDWSDSDAEGKTLPARREQVQQRLERTVSWLRELGFSADPRAASMGLESLPDSGRLPRSPLRIKRSEWLVSGYPAWRYDVWKDGRVVAHFGENVSTTACALTYLPSASALAVQCTTDAAEGCDDGPNAFAQLLPIP
jgi:tetratricopeptide (TPR) repeat protein